MNVKIFDEVIDNVPEYPAKYFERENVYRGSRSNIVYELRYIVFFCNYYIKKGYASNETENLFN